MDTKQDQLILDIKIANYRKLKQQQIDWENYFQQQLPNIRQHKLNVFHDDMHALSKELFTGLPVAIGSMILFRSLIVIPIALVSVFAIQKNAYKIYDYICQEY